MARERKNTHGSYTGTCNIITYRINIILDELKLCLHHFYYIQEYYKKKVILLACLIHSWFYWITEHCRAKCKQTMNGCWPCVGCPLNVETRWFLSFFPFTTILSSSTTSASVFIPNISSLFLFCFPASRITIRYSDTVRSGVRICKNIYMEGRTGNTGVMKIKVSILLKNVQVNHSGRIIPLLDIRQFNEVYVTSNWNLPTHGLRL